MKQDEQKLLLAALRARFESNPRRHAGIAWPEVAARLADNPARLRALSQMEATGGEPDVIARDGKTGEITFADCAPETPAGRRSLCYDGAALAARKENKPQGSAMDMAASMGIALMTEAEYVDFQRLGPFDLKTSSWLLAPAAIREQGGAIFGDSRYGRTFVYHNGPQSYYASRGFRGLLRV